VLEEPENSAGLSQICCFVASPQLLHSEAVKLLSGRGTNSKTTLGGGLGGVRSGITVAASFWEGISRHADVQLPATLCRAHQLSL